MGANRQGLPLLFGFELECQYSLRNVPLQVDGYHCGSQHSTQWRIESDGSLRNTSSTLNGCAEIISPPFSRNDIKKTFNELRGILRLGDSDNLTSHVGFNDTTGCHIHVSFNGQPPSELFTFAYAKIARKRIFSFMKRTLGEPRFTAWKRNFTRTMAADIADWTTDKYRWVRIHPGVNTLEFRGFHVRGATTFTELKTWISGAIDQLYRAFAYCLRTQDHARVRRVAKQICEEHDRNVYGYSLDTDDDSFTVISTHVFDTEEDIVQPIRHRFARRS